MTAPTIRLAAVTMLLALSSLHADDMTPAPAAPAATATATVADTTVTATVTAQPEAPRIVSSPLEFKMTTITGQPVDLATYSGKVVLIVNVASKCGLTPQYAALQAVFDKYKDQGFMVLGVPANNFGGQEPGTEAEIQTFCTTKFNVSFDMLSKVSVKGGDTCPLYQYLTSKTAGHPFGGEITWNFEKFLVGRDGKLVARFAPQTKPDDAAVTAAIETALKVEAK